MNRIENIYPLFYNILMNGIFGSYSSWLGTSSKFRRMRSFTLFSTRKDYALFISINAYGKSEGHILSTSPRTREPSREMKGKYITRRENTVRSLENSLEFRFV